MKPYLRFQRFQNESPVWVISCRFFFLLGISLWLGAIAFFAFGAAGVPFAVAKSWNLTGTNPVLANQVVTYKTIGGAITSQMLIKLNQVEVLALLLTTIAFIFTWMPDHNRSSLLLAQTFLMAAMAILLLIYSEKIGVRMREIQATFPIDFSIENELLKTVQHKEFDTLHKRYSFLVSLNAIGAVVQLLLFSINPLAKTRPHKEINEVK